MRGVQHLLVAVLLLLVPRLETALLSAGQVRPAGRPAGAGQPWYISKVEDHDHEHMQQPRTRRLQQRRRAHGS